MGAVDVGEEEVNYTLVEEEEGVEEEWSRMKRQMERGRGEEEEEEGEEGEEGEEEEGEERGGKEGRTVEVELVWYEEGKWREEKTVVKCSKKAVESPWEGYRKSCVNVIVGEDGEEEVVMFMKQDENGEIVGGEFVIPLEYKELLKNAEGGEATFAWMVMNVVKSRNRAGSHARTLVGHHMFINMDGFPGTKKMEESKRQRYEKARELKEKVTDAFKKSGKEMVYEFFRTGFSLRVGDKCFYKEQADEMVVVEVNYERCEGTVMNNKGQQFLVGLNNLKAKENVYLLKNEERQKVFRYFHTEEKEGKESKIKNHEAFFYYAFYRHLCKDVNGGTIADFLTRERKEEIEKMSFLEATLLDFVKNLFDTLGWGGSEDAKTERRIKKYIYVIVLAALMKVVYDDLNRQYSEYYGENPKKKIEDLVKEMEEEAGTSSGKRKRNGKSLSPRKKNKSGKPRSPRSSLPPTPSKIIASSLSSMKTISDEDEDTEDETFDCVSSLATMHSKNDRRV